MLAQHKGPSAQNGKLSWPLVILAGVLATTVALIGATRHRAPGGTAARHEASQQQEEPAAEASSHDEGDRRVITREMPAAPLQKTLPS